MKAVGIKQLKSKLSEYVRLIRAGETILVTDRDEVVAELGPPRHHLGEAGSVDAVLDRLAERGWVTRPDRPKSGWRWKPVALELPEERAQGILDDLRADR